MEEINIYKLHEEWVNHASLYEEWDKELRIAQQQRDTVKDNLDKLKADLSLKIRENPTAYNLQKVTDSAVDSAITMDPGYQRMLGDFRMFNGKLEEAKGKILVLDTRKKALENLGSLYISHYWSTPDVVRVNGKTDHSDERQFSKIMKEKLEPKEEVKKDKEEVQEVKTTTPRRRGRPRKT